jgi:hypothetical protein
MKKVGKEKVNLVGKDVANCNIKWIKNNFATKKLKRNL